MSLSRKSDGDMGTALPRGLSGSLDATRLRQKNERQSEGTHTPTHTHKSGGNFTAESTAEAQIIFWLVLSVTFGL